MELPAALAASGDAQPRDNSASRSSRLDERSGDRQKPSHQDKEDPWSIQGIEHPQNACQELTQRFQSISNCRDDRRYRVRAPLRSRYFVIARRGGRTRYELREEGDHDQEDTNTQNDQPNFGQSHGRNLSEHAGSLQRSPRKPAPPHAWAAGL